jgi:hypothetical protein
MVNTDPISQVRHQASPIYSVEYLTVGDHGSEIVTVSGIWLAKPLTVFGEYYATCIKLQALVQNIRYTIDTKPATAIHGFQLTAGSETLIPVPNHGLSIVAEGGQATIQYQWVR